MTEVPSRVLCAPHIELSCPWSLSFILNIDENPLHLKRINSPGVQGSVEEGLVVNLEGRNSSKTYRMHIAALLASVFVF